MSLPNPLDPRRFLPEEAFPAYAFVPGQQPHPFSDPRGHSFGQRENETPALTPSWQQCRPFLRGLDLFHHGYYWEAHEAWEGAWKGLDRSDPHSALLQGLIHLAAAGVKVREGRPDGVRSHGLRAGGHFRRLADRFLLDLDVDHLQVVADQVADQANAWPTHAGAVVAVVFPFRLVPDGPSKLHPLQVT